jgi:hypothetical protein
MPTASRWVLNGSPFGCAFCNEPLRGEAQRRGEQYFCNELCADACAEPVRHPLSDDGTPHFFVVGA